LYQWANDHPEFLTALKVARGAQQLKYEQFLLGHMRGEDVAGQASTIFGLENTHSPDWDEHAREQEAQAAQPATVEHRHIHVHMTPTEAAERYQQLLKEL
jgi:hypothetical protein